jgi:flagellar hook-length control protein FliK
MQTPIVSKAAPAPPLASEGVPRSTGRVGLDFAHLLSTLKHPNNERTGRDVGFEAFHTPPTSVEREPENIYEEDKDNLKLEDQPSPKEPDATTNPVGYPSRVDQQSSEAHPEKKPGDSTTAVDEAGAKNSSGEAQATNSSSSQTTNSSSSQTTTSKSETVPVDVKTSIETSEVKTKSSATQEVQVLKSMQEGQEQIKDTQPIAGQEQAKDTQPEAGQAPENAPANNPGQISASPAPEDKVNPARSGESTGTISLTNSPTSPADGSTGKEATPPSGQNPPSTDLTAKVALAMGTKAQEESGNGPEDGLGKKNEALKLSPEEALRTDLVQSPGVKESGTTLNLGEPARMAEARNAGPVRQVSEGLENLIKSGQSSLRIQLNPKDLGRIELRLITGADGTSVIINAEHPVSSAMLESHLNDLRQSLADAGIQLNKLSVGDWGSHHQSTANQHSQQYKLPLAKEAGSTWHEKSVAEAPTAPVSSGSSSLVDYRI